MLPSQDLWADTASSLCLECCFNQNSCETSASKLNFAGDQLEPQETSRSLMSYLRGVGLTRMGMGWCRCGGKLMKSSMRRNQENRNRNSWKQEWLKHQWRNQTQIMFYHLRYRQVSSRLAVSASHCKAHVGTGNFVCISMCGFFS